MKYIALWGLVLASGIVQAVPNSINSPVNGSGWINNQHGTIDHKFGGG